MGNLLVITNKEIAAEMEKSFGLKIDKKKIECSIKSLGEHKRTIKLHPEVKAEITVITKVINNGRCRII